MPFDNNMTAEQIKAEIDRTQEQQRQLEEQYKAAKLEKMRDIVTVVKDQAQEHDIDLGDIVAMLMPAKRAKRSSDKPRAHFRCLETGNVYKGGRIPGWLVKQMEATGFDYETYKDEYMEQVV
jgi:DNA-binding protein H-NS